MDPYDFGRFFRGILGFGRSGGGSGSTGYRDEDLDRHFESEGREGDEMRVNPDVHDEIDRFSQPFGGNSFNFRVFTDPLEIHKFFEKEMEQMFKEFGGIGGIMDQRKFLEDLPSRIQELPPDRDGGGGAGGSNDQHDRDFMLKQDSASPWAPPAGDRTDTDMDDKDLTSQDLDKLFKKSKQEDEGRPQPRHPWGGGGGGLFGSGGEPGSGFNFYSYSKSVRTVQKPDGSVEIEERTRNPDGSESVTIRRRQGDHEETIHQDGGEDGPLVPFSGGGGFRGEDPFPSNQLPPGFDRFFSGFFGGHHQSPFDGRGHRQQDDSLAPPVMVPPARDRMFSSLFSQLFGDQRRED